MTHSRYFSIRLAAAIAVMSFVGCTTVTIPATPTEPVFESMKTKESGNVRVTVAVLGPEECLEVFGAPLIKEDIQPVWIHIENRDDIAYFFQASSIDSDYFPPLEVAYKFHSRLDGDLNRRLEEHFDGKAIGTQVEPGHSLSGFVYAHADLGGKYVYVKLIGVGRVKEFSFHLDVPGGIRADVRQADLDSAVPPDTVVDVEEAELREKLEAFPCCTTDKDGQKTGDPLNLVLVGTLDELMAAFSRQRWDETEVIYGRSIWKTTMSFLFGTRYRYSPVSPLYMNGRPQDFAMQKVRSSINARNHLRLWLTSMRFEGMPVWIGQISRDIGVRFTLKTWNLTTHRISADIDETRDFLIEDLLKTNRVEAIGFVEGVGGATPTDERTNLTGDAYFTDGLRAVVLFTDKIVPVHQIRVLPWAWPPRKRASPLLDPGDPEGADADANRPVTPVSGGRE